MPLSWLQTFGAGIEEILRRGNGADRQLRAFDARGDVVEVVRGIADETEAVGAPATDGASA